MKALKTPAIIAVILLFSTMNVLSSPDPIQQYMGQAKVEKLRVEFLRDGNLVSTMNVDVNLLDPTRIIDQRKPVLTDTKCPVGHSAKIADSQLVAGNYIKVALSESSASMLKVELNYEFSRVTDMREMKTEACKFLLPVIDSVDGNLSFLLERGQSKTVSDSTSRDGHLVVRITSLPLKQ